MQTILKNPGQTRERSLHVSWVDTPVIGSVLPVHLLSKVEVRTSPLIGWLAQETGTLFLRRAAATRQPLLRARRQKRCRDSLCGR